MLQRCQNAFFFKKNLLHILLVRMRVFSENGLYNPRPKPSHYHLACLDVTQSRIVTIAVHYPTRNPSMCAYAEILDVGSCTLFKRT